MAFCSSSYSSIVRGITKNLCLPNPCLSKKEPGQAQPNPKTCFPVFTKLRYELLTAF